MNVEDVMFVLLILSNEVVRPEDMYSIRCSVTLDEVNDVVRCLIYCTDTLQWRRNWSRRYSIVGSVTLSWSRWSEK